MGLPLYQHLMCIFSLHPNNPSGTIIPLMLLVKKQIWIDWVSCLRWHSSVAGSELSLPCQPTSSVYEMFGIRKDFQNLKNGYDTNRRHRQGNLIVKKNGITQCWTSELHGRKDLSFSPLAHSNGSGFLGNMSLRRKGVKIDAIVSLLSLTFSPLSSALAPPRLRLMKN